MTVAQSRVLRVAAWVGAVLLVLTFVLRKYSYRVHPDLFLALTYPMPAVVVVALLAGALVAAAWCMPASRGRADRAASWLAWRPRAGLTQAELAERIKTTQSAVARMESGRTPPCST